MKDDQHQHKKNITTWISQVRHEIWDAIRREESANPDHPLGWSEWIAQKANLALNMGVLRVETNADMVETHHLQRQIAKLQDRTGNLNRERLECLTRGSCGSYQMDTPALAISYRGCTTQRRRRLMRLSRDVADGEIECDETGSRRRLKA